MKRFHVHTHVHDLQASIAFYSKLFAAPPTQQLEWSDKQIEGIWRFLNRVWRLAEAFTPGDDNRLPKRTPGDGAECTVMGFPLIDRLGAQIKITRGIVSSGSARGSSSGRSWRARHEDCHVPLRPLLAAAAAPHQAHVIGIADTDIADRPHDVPGDLAVFRTAGFKAEEAAIAVYDRLYPLYRTMYFALGRPDAEPVRRDPQRQGRKQVRHTRTSALYSLAPVVGTKGSLPYIARYAFQTSFSVVPRGIARKLGSPHQGLRRSPSWSKRPLPPAAAPVDTEELVTAEALWISARTGVYGCVPMLVAMVFGLDPSWGMLLVPFIAFVTGFGWASFGILISAVMRSSCATSGSRRGCTRSR